jgi:hypothetical protein
LIARVLAVFVSAWAPTGKEGSDTMTSNIYNGAPRGRRELDRDRDAGRRSEAIGAGSSLEAAASMNLGRDSVPSELFRAQPLGDSQREWLRHVQRAADLFSDEEILALSEDCATQLVERLVVELVLLEEEAYSEDHGSTRAPVLVVPFTDRSRVIPISSSWTQDP